MNSKLNAMLTKLASNPLASFKRFLLGFALFIIGLLPLLYAPFIPWLNYACLGLVGLGALISASAYISLLVNRIFHFYKN